MMEKYIIKLESFIQKSCGIVEIAAALLILVGILLSIFGILKDFMVFGSLIENVSMFKQYLEDIFIIVIGAEFLQMLCRPTTDNVIEVVIFLLARHMIVEDTSTFENFLSVVSIVFLCVVSRYLRLKEKKDSSLEERMME